MQSDEHQNKTRNIDKIQQNYIASHTFSWRLPEPKCGFRESVGIHLRATLQEISQFMFTANQHLI